MFERKKEKREHNTLKRVYLCMKKSVRCVTVHIFVFLWRTTGGRFLSLSLNQLSEIEGEMARRMCKDVEKGLEMIISPPPSLSLSLFIFLFVSLSYHRCETSKKKRPHSSQPTLQIEHSPVKMS